MNISTLRSIAMAAVLPDINDINTTYINARFKSGNSDGKKLIGLHPSGLVMYADPIIESEALDYLHGEQIRAGMIPRGFHRVVTDLYGNYVLVKASSQQEAIDKYLSRNRNREQ